MVGERLAELRKDKGFTQQELGDKLSLTLETISKYERGISEPNDEIKVELAKFFDVSLDYLLGVIDEQISYKRKNAIYLPKEFPDEAIADINKHVELVLNSHKYIQLTKK